MEKDYIDRKIKQCKKLVRESTDPAQRKVYREFAQTFLLDTFYNNIALIIRMSKP